MGDQHLTAIDPREAFDAPTLRTEDRSLAASQAALLLAARSGVLGLADDPERLRSEEEVRAFPLPELQKLRRPRRLSVAEAEQVPPAFPAAASASAPALLSALSCR